MFQSPLKTVSEKIKPVESKSSVSSLKFERPSDFKKFINFIKNETKELEKIKLPKTAEVESKSKRGGVLGLLGLGLFGLLGSAFGDDDGKGRFSIGGGTRSQFKPVKIPLVGGVLNEAKRNTNIILRTEKTSEQIREKRLDKFRKERALRNKKIKEINEKLKGKKKFGVALANKNMITECESIGVDFYKVLSWDLKDYDYITDLLDKTSKHIYVSTGTSSISDLDKFHKRFGNINRLSFIHTQLTFEAKDTNLKSIQTISDKYNIPVGYGIHCKNLNTMYSSLSFSPSDIWFYVKGSDYETHPDEIHSVPLNDVGEFIENLREVNLSIGDGWKKNTNTKWY